MARIIPGPIVADATGKIGDVVFSHLFDTSYVKRKQRPYVSNTPAQQAQRDLFAFFSRAYAKTLMAGHSLEWHIAFHLKKACHTLFISSLLNTVKHSESRPFYPQARGIPDPVISSYTTDPDFITLTGTLHPQPFITYSLLTVIDTFGNVGAGADLTFPGDPYIPVFILAGQNLTPPYYAILIVSNHGIYPGEFPPDILWGRGQTLILS